MAAPPQDSQDVTLASADPDLLLCWERKVKQGKECSLLLEYRNGKVTTTLKVSKARGSEARTPISDSKSQAEKKNKESGRKKKKNLLKLLDYQQKLVKEKGLPPSNLMLKQAAEAPSPPPPAQKPGLKDGGTFQCDHCDNTFNSQRKLRKHIRKKHANLQKPEELRDGELDKSLNLSVASEERCNSSLSVTDSLVKPDKVSDQELYDLFVVTGECGFCEYRHPVSYRSQDERILCQQYPDRDREQYEHMDTHHMDVVDMLEEY